MDLATPNLFSSDNTDCILLSGRETLLHFQFGATL
ncbi:hypothetical protein TIFTF001_056826 [Ficus carica]|uniref:Uncharacterized protein n=1 Tax=Ficus carica TaxID=3494 RepID=A0AA88JI54_FICCA|nr:hypothetical protein TIFTF001_056826 [Ficus carica]